MVQLEDSGVIGYAVNGKSFPATVPLQMNQGESMLIHYINAGARPTPCICTEWHKSSSARTGSRSEHPYKADTVMVAPGERYSVLVVATKPAAGRSTATSSRTPRTPRGCSGCSPSSSSPDPAYRTGTER